MNDIDPQPAKLPVPIRVRNYLRGLAIRVLVYLAAYFLLAFLTIGPCFWSWFAATYVDGPKWVAKFYTPFLWLCDRCGPLSWLVNKYVKWWIL